MNIEELLKQRKDQLDVETPPDEAWLNIRSGWKKETSSRPTYIWKAAAMIFMALSIGLLSYSLLLHNKVEQLASLSDISSHYADLEESYKEKVAQIESRLPIQAASEKEELTWIFDELNILEEINDQYRADIGMQVDENRLVEVLIDYYEKRIRLLRKLELEIERTQQHENETSNPTITHS